MMPAIRALTWEILARHRWFVGGSAVWLAVACLVAALLPESLRGENTAAALLAPVSVGAILFLVGVTHGEQTRLDTRSGEFPRRLLLLPVPAGVLAGVPLALALAVPVLVWTAAAVGILRPCGVRAAIFWPGLHFGVLMVWLLALGWSPMPLRWARLVFSGALVVSLYAGAILVVHFAVPESRILLCLAVLALIAVILAVRGVSRSRHEGRDGTESAARSTPLEGGVSIRRFRSPLRAQLWLEWRTHGRGLLILTFVLGLFFVVGVALTERALRRDPFLLKAVASESGQRLGPAWLALTWLLVIPVILAGASGGEMGRFSRTQKSSSVPAFVGLLPVTTADLAKGKFLAPLIHLALMWGILLALAVGWAVVGGHAADMAERLIAACGSPITAAAAVVVTLAAACLTTYLISVGSMWGGLFGSPVIAPLPALLGTFEIVVAVLIDRNWRPGSTPVLLAGLWVILAVKLLLASCLVCYDQRHFRLGWKGLAVPLLAWAAFTAVPASVASWLADDPTAALVVVVVSPLVSCLAAPAVLSRARHGAWA